MSWPRDGKSGEQICYEIMRVRIVRVHRRLRENKRRFMLLLRWREGEITRAGGSRNLCRQTG